MSKVTTESAMFWTTSNVVESSKFFQQRYNYSLKSIPVEKEDDYIPLLVGDESLRCFSFWIFVSEANRIQQ